MHYAQVDQENTLGYMLDRDGKWHYTNSICHGPLMTTYPKPK